VIDLGSGPLTLPLALWLFRPELRRTPLEFRCLDRTAPALDAGRRLFAALAGEDSPWIIRTIHAPLGASVKGPPAALVTAINLYNEVFWDIPHSDRRSLEELAEKEGRRLLALAFPAGSILVVEPGVPRSGEFIAALRDALLRAGRPPRSPCPHAGACPFPGGKAPSGSGEPRKWCHFAFDTDAAPPALRELSAAAGLPKDRGVLSFLLAGPPAEAVPPSSASRHDAPEPLAVRILSDAFPLGGNDGRSRYGRYGCSARGMALAAGGKAELEALDAGTLAWFELPREERRDPKTGALVVEAGRGVSIYPE
jgi:hypothetical protein